MDSLELPLDMQWASVASKAEPLSPTALEGFTNDPFAAELWSITKDESLSCFEYADKSAIFATTIGQSAQEKAEKLITEELLQLIEFKEEEGQWFNQENMDLSSLTSAQDTSGSFAVSAFPPQQQQQHFNSPSSLYSASNSHLPLGAAAPTPSVSSGYVAGDSFAGGVGYQHLTPPQSPPTYNGAALSSSSATTTQFNVQSSLQFDGPSAFPFAADRSFVDLQLQSNECLDKTFVLSSSDSPPPVDADQLALDLIDEFLRNNTKPMHENYVLVGQGGEAEGESLQGPSMEEELDFCDDNATQFSTPSYGNSLASSPSRSGSPAEDSPDDDEWLPEGPSSSSPSLTKRRKAKDSVEESPKTKRRPYERGVGEVEKKSRKKEQNKNAATRYRQKKKQEIEEILEEENRLKKTNKKLVAQFNDARREMKYLKNLLRDMYKQNDILV